MLAHIDKGKKKEWSQYWINRGLTAVEQLLSASAGKYCVGDEITLADCCLIPQLFNARLFGIDLNQFPTILRIDKELENHPAFTAAHPTNQPDCELDENK